MSVVLPTLESMDWIYRYAWFSVRLSGQMYPRQEDSMLWNEDTRGLTALGVQYRAFATRNCFKFSK